MNDDDKTVELPPHPHAEAAGLTVREGKWYVERSGAMGDAAERGLIPVQPFVSAPAYVNVKFGMTIPIARFEPVRLDVGLSMPCYPADVDRTYEEAAKWVSDRIEKDRAEIEAYARERAENEKKQSDG